MNSGETYSSHYPSPIGIIKFSFDIDSLKRIKFVDDNNNKGCNNLYYNKKGIRKKYNKIYDQLNEYFTGRRKNFNLTISYQGTDFEKKVWSYLMNIPYGKQKTYKEIAREIGNQKAARAVGNACKKNPLNIIIPCHRVIKKDGSTGDYSGNSHRKKWLIEHEKKYKE